MTLLPCAAARRCLAAYYDGELSLGEQVSVAAHVDACQRCAWELDRLRLVGRAVREGAAALPAPPDAARLEDTIVGRVTVERQQELPARLGRLFEDMHLVWAGLAATAATCVCAVLLLGLWYLAPPERDDSLAGILSALASPGSDRNPVPPDGRMVLPRVMEPLLPAALQTETLTEDDVVLALAAVVTREGRVAYPSVLHASRHDRAAVARLVHAAVGARFTPASYGGSPVAVNMVWVLTHTTVRGSARAATGPV